jgi:hypothetical protein
LCSERQGRGVAMQDDHQIGFQKGGEWFHYVRSCSLVTIGYRCRSPVTTKALGAGKRERIVGSPSMGERDRSDGCAMWDADHRSARAK